MNTSDNQTKTGQSRSDVIVVRGGVATPQQIQRGVAEHVQVTGLTGFSVQSSPGKTIDELAAAGQFRNRQISITTVGELEDAGTALEAILKIPGNDRPDRFGKPVRSKSWSFGIGS